MTEPFDYRYRGTYDRERDPQTEPPAAAVGDATVELVEYLRGVMSLHGSRYAPPSEWKRGDRVVLDHTTDPYTHLRSGARGTVEFIDSMGTVFVKWSDGSTLGLLARADRWHREGQS